MKRLERETAVLLLALQRARGPGSRTIAALWRSSGSARTLTARIAALVDAAAGPGRAPLAVTDGGPAIARDDVRGLRALCDPDGEARREAGEIIDRMLGRGVRVLSFASPDYPAVLFDLSDPPPILFLDGDAELMSRGRAVAVVGTRRPSSYGRHMAYALSRELARWGWTVISGMATGIDSEAHRGALDAGGRSIGVLGCGLSHVYPPSNRPLYRRMREGGLLATEFEPAMGPTRYTFPQRNRVIAAASRAVIVVEAGARSGALITADHALDVGREVLAVPGRVNDPGGAGVLHLLKRGAGAVGDARDVFDALGWLHDGEPGPERTDTLSSESAAAAGPDARLLGLFGTDERSADEVAAELGVPIRDVLAGLGRLELRGFIVRGPTGRFARPPGSAE